MLWSCRAQSERFGTQIYSETVNKVDLSQRPFKVYTDEKQVLANTIIVATGRLPGYIAGLGRSSRNTSRQHTTRLCCGPGCGCLKNTELLMKSAVAGKTTFTAHRGVHALWRASV